MEVREGLSKRSQVLTVRLPLMLVSIDASVKGGGGGETKAQIQRFSFSCRLSKGKVGR